MNNLFLNFSSILGENNKYLPYILIGAGVLILIFIVALIFGSKRKIIFMVNDSEKARSKYKVNKKITIPTELGNYTWFTDKELSNEFKQEKMKFKSITVYGQEIVDKTEKETFLDGEITDDNKSVIKVKIGSLAQNYINKLNKLTDQQKADYVEIKNEILSYSDFQISITKDGDAFKYKNKTRVKITVLNGILKVFVDIEKDKIDGRFKRIDESKFKKYSSVPLEFTIDRPVEVRKAKNTISRLASGLELQKQEVVNRSFEKLTLQ